MSEQRGGQVYGMVKETLGEGTPFRQIWVVDDPIQIVIDKR